MSMIYLCPTFQLPSSNSSLVNAIKPNTKKIFARSPYVILHSTVMDCHCTTHNAPLGADTALIEVLALRPVTGKSNIIKPTLLTTDKEPIPETSCVLSRSTPTSTVTFL